MVRWAVAIVVGQTLGTAAVLIVAGLILGVPPGRLVAPIVLLFLSALATPGLFLWVRAARGQRTAWALRNAAACLVQSQLIAAAFALGAVQSGLIAGESLLRWYAPIALLCLIAASAGVFYLSIRGTGA